MKDYSSLKINPLLKIQDSLSVKAVPRRSVLEWDSIDIRSSIIPPSTTLTNGTIYNTLIGTPTISGGNFNNGNIGTPTIVGGTINNVVLGTVSTTGGTINNATLGSPTSTGGIYTSGTFNSAVIGSPTITGGSYITGTFAGTPVITNPSATGGTAVTITLGTPAIVGGTASGFTFSNKVSVITGANMSVGQGTLASGVATITTTSAIAASNIFVTPIASGLNLGILAIGTINSGTNFVVSSSNVLDNDSFNWWVIN